jgi:hypothetical protein
MDYTVYLKVSVGFLLIHPLVTCFKCLKLVKTMYGAKQARILGLKYIVHKLKGLNFKGVKKEPYLIINRRENPVYTS